MALNTCPICNRGSNTAVHPGCLRRIPTPLPPKIQRERIKKPNEDRVLLPFAFLRKATTLKNHINNTRL